MVLSGAGISAESGVRTFRDHDGLWENHRVEDVATPDAWRRNPALVNKFYNARRAQLDTVEPNAGHRALVHLEFAYEVVIVTQNVDDLHERAGSSRVIHLHGELRKVRSARRASEVLDWTGDLGPDDRCSAGEPLRPHIVWFGEPVPLLEVAAEELLDAERVIIVGTSLQVYPAAALIEYAPAEAEVVYIDPRPNPNVELTRRERLRVIAEPAASALPRLVHEWLS